MRDFAKHVEEIRANGRHFEAWPTGRYSEDPLYVERTLRQGLDLGIVACKDFGVIPLVISLCRDWDSIVVVVEFDEPPAGSLYWEGRLAKPRARALMTKYNRKKENQKEKETTRHKY